jgi:predicted dehydrogenase
MAVADCGAAFLFSHPQKFPNARRFSVRIPAGGSRLHIPLAMASAAVPLPEEPPRPVRFGIMSCGSIARKLARAMLLVGPAVDVAAVASRSGDKARLFAAENGLPAGTRLHGSYEALLDDPDIDAIYLPLPTSLHPKWATAAAERGKHLLLEKPTALCVADLDPILAACEASGVQFMDSTMWMHNPRTAKMRQLIADQSTIGDVRVVSSFFFAAFGFCSNLNRLVIIIGT